MNVTGDGVAMVIGWGVIVVVGTVVLSSVAYIGYHYVRNTIRFFKLQLAVNKIHGSNRNNLDYYWFKLVWYIFVKKAFEFALFGDGESWYNDEYYFDNKEAYTKPHLKEDAIDEEDE